MVLFTRMGQKTNKRHVRLITPLYVINIIFQAFISLISPAVLLFFVAWLLDRYTSVGGWIYAVCIIFGVICGFSSMISFIIKASRALEALEKQNSTSERK